MRRGLLATCDELANLRDRVETEPFTRIYDALRKRCALILETRPITELDWRTAHAHGQQAAGLQAARSIQGRVFDLAICASVERSAAYRDRAIEELRNLAHWSSWSDPTFRDGPADLCTAECCATMAIGLDWLAEAIGEDDRHAMLAALRERGLGAYSDAVTQETWWYTCYHNWNAVINGGCGLAALLLAENDPLARSALDEARAGLEHFFDALAADGGWDEGTGYWGTAMRYVLLLGRAIERKLDDRSIFVRRGMDQTGLFPLYFCPNGQSASFGDAPSVPAFGTFYLLAERYNQPAVAWWLDRYGFDREVRATGWSDLGLALLFRPTDLPAEPEVELPPLKVFSGIGWAAACDRWPEPQLYAALKTGDLSAHHSHFDMNALQVQFRGEMLLTDLGSPSLSRAYFSDRERHYQATSPAHNTVIVGDRGHRLDGRGQIVDAQVQPQLRYLAGDAGDSLGEQSRHTRHVLMLLDAGGHGQTLLVLDDVRNSVPEAVTAYWHSLAPMALKGRRGMIRGTRGELHMLFSADQAIRLELKQHELPRGIDHALAVRTPAVADVLLLSAFSGDPLGAIDMQWQGPTLVLEGSFGRVELLGGRGRLRLEKFTSP